MAKPLMTASESLLILQEAADRVRQYTEGLVATGRLPRLSGRCEVCVRYHLPTGDVLCGKCKAAILEAIGDE